MSIDECKKIWDSLPNSHSSGAALVQSIAAKLTQLTDEFEDGHNSGLDYNAPIITKLSAENAALKEKMEQQLAGFKECIKEDIDIQVAQQKEINALKEQVAQANSRFNQIRITRNQLLEELTLLQSKSAALVDALTQIAEFKGQPSRIASEALAAFQGGK